MFISLSSRCLIVLLALLTISTANSQITKVPYRVGNLWGFADTLGTIITPPQYDSVDFEHFQHHNFVFKNNFVGVVNEHGKEIISPIYSKIRRNSARVSYWHGRSLYALRDLPPGYFVTANGREGFVDTLGKSYLPPSYDSMCVGHTIPNEDAYIFLAKQKNKYVIVTSQQKKLVDNIIDVKWINPSTYILAINDKYGIYDLNTQQWLVLPVYQQFERIKSSQLNAKFDKKQYYLITKKVATYYIINYKYQIIDSITTDNIAQVLYDENRLPEPEVFAFIPQKTAETLVNITDLKTKKNYNIYEENLQKKEVDIGNPFLLIQSLEYELQNKKITISYQMLGKQSVIIDDKLDEVKLIADTREKDELNVDTRFLAIRKGKKWGIYSLAINEWVTPIAYKKISLSPTGQIFLLHKGKKIGILDANRDAPTNFIAPRYQSFYDFNTIKYTDGKYRKRNFYCYTFLKNGKKYIIGQNGVVFAK
jgi:hypothetical protein